MKFFVSAWRNIFRNKHKSTALIATAIFLLLTSAACIQKKDTSMDLDQAYSEIGVAIESRAARCGNRPGYPLLLPGHPSEYGVRLCSLLILQEDCPFNDYPIACLEIYTETCENCDLPLYNP